MPTHTNPITGKRMISTSEKNPISDNATPAIDPSSAARGTARNTVEPANESIVFNTPITIIAAMPRCHVASAAAASSMPCCLKVTNAGPSTSKPRPIVVGASMPSGIAHASARPLRTAMRV